jgi:hypothetical protein
MTRTLGARHIPEPGSKSIGTCSLSGASCQTHCEANPFQDDFDLTPEKKVMRKHVEQADNLIKRFKDSAPPANQNSQTSRRYSMGPDEQTCHPWLSDSQLVDGASECVWCGCLFVSACVCVCVCAWIGAAVSQSQQAYQ